MKYTRPIILILSLLMVSRTTNALSLDSREESISRSPESLSKSSITTNDSESKPTSIVISEDSIPAECKRASFEISSPADIQAISTCKVVAGDVSITNYKDPILSFEAIEHILGNLVIKKSPEIVRIEAPNVISISKLFSLKELTSLSLISFPSLRSVKVLDWKVLPILSNVLLDNEIRDLESITVADTSLIGFSGFLTDKLETLDINNNRFLESINSNVEKITGKLHVAANAVDVKVFLPKLKSANNVSIHEVSELDLSSLEEIDHSFNIINNLFTSIKLPKLKSIGGTLSLLKNEKLNKVEFPQTTEIGGGLMVVNNTNITKVDFLPKLSIIGGALELVGNIKETSMKSLKLVKGSAKVRSYISSFDCTKWSRSDISSVIRGGKIECTNGNNQRVVANTPTEGGNYQNSPGINTTSDASSKFANFTPFLTKINLVCYVAVFVAALQY